MNVGSYVAVEMAHRLNQQTADAKDTVSGNRDALPWRSLMFLNHEIRVAIARIKCELSGFGETCGTGK